MNQLFNITINGQDVTERHVQSSISELVGRAYDMVSFTLDDQSDVILNSDVVINYGDNTFTGFVYSSKKSGHNSRSIICRTNTAKFTDPNSTSEEKLEDATTSHELCALYASEVGVPITITSEDLDFGGSYERNGTMLSALTNIASVTGAEMYDDGSGTLIIAPNKEIPLGVEGTIIPDSDIQNYVEDFKSVFNNGVGFVIIQNGGLISSDIISNNGIYAEVDECSGELFVFPNPYGAIEESKGISELKPLILQRKEENSLLDDDVIYLDGAIDVIHSVTLNGAIITDFNFVQGHNVIYFTTTKRGTLEVVYDAKAYQGYSNVKVEPLGRFISFDMYYLDQVMKFQGFLEDVCSNTQTDGDMTCIVPSEMRYDAGFKVYTIGGDPEFTFYNKNLVLIRDVVSADIEYVSVESITLEETVSGYRYRTRYPITAVLGVQSSHVDVPYTTGSDADGDYIDLTSYYPDMMISYQTSAKEHYIQFERIIDGFVSMVIRNRNTDQVCEYSPHADIPCELNQDIYVDVAGELSLEVTDIRGSTVPIADPNDAVTNTTVDNFGFIIVDAQINGSYVINTSTIKPKTSITMTANV